jgi:hypothetical protein
MAPTRPPRVRHAALRAVADAGEDLASIANDPMSQDLDATPLDELSHALSHQNSMPPSDYVDQRNCCYLQLISALTKNDEWCKRLTRDGLVEWCISSSLYDTVLASSKSMVLDKVFLAGILLQIDPSGTDISPNPAQEKRWKLVNSAWARYRYFYKENIEALPALVAVTRQNLPDFMRTKLADLASAVHEALQSLKDQRILLGHANVLLIDAALPIVQGLYDELSPYAEHPSVSQHNNGS